VTPANWVSAVGLGLNLLGSLCLWWYGPRHSIARVYEHATLMTPSGAIARVVAAVGWPLLLLGFLLQLVGLLMQ
jgi:hypothetical protein